MSDRAKRRFPVAFLVGAGVAVVGLVVLVLGLVAMSGAAAELRDATTTAEDQAAAAAAAADDLEAAEYDLADAQEALVVAEGDLAADLDELATASDELATAERRLSTAAANLRAVEGLTPALASAIDESMAETADGVTAAIGELLRIRRAQVEAVGAEDYRGYNELASEHTSALAAAIEAAVPLAAGVEGLPEVATSDPFRYDGPGFSAEMSNEPTVLDPPTGPAKVTVVLPDQSSCIPFGDRGCQYKWTAQFTESNALGVTIERIGIRYRGGGGYCTVNGEWKDVDLYLGPNGSLTRNYTFRVDRANECSPVIGGDILLRWEGTDDDGRSLSGRATADLEWP